MLPEAGGRREFPVWGHNGCKCLPRWYTHTLCEQRSHILPAYFTVHIKWQCRQGWVGLPGSGLLIKLITMVTGRERSHLPTPIILHNSFKWI